MSQFRFGFEKSEKKEKACFVAKKFPSIPRVNDAFSHWSSATTTLSNGELAKTKSPRLLQFLAGILNTGSFPDPVYPFTRTIESVHFISI